MTENKKITLPSGAVLEIGVAPFSVAKALYQAVAGEAKGVKVDPNQEIDANLWKDLALVALESKKIEAALAECLKRCTYNGLKISDSTFEPVEARGDYLTVCFEVAKENVLPFMKSLYAQFSDILAQGKKAQA